MSSAQTSFDSSDPSLRPPKFQRRRDSIFDAILHLLEDQEAYKIESKDAAAHRVTAKRNGFGGAHQVEIWVEGEPAGPVSVHMRSSGGSFLDFGQAKRNIREFTRLLHHRES
ncbi:MAG: DUF1499 domain-containing protein [Planctomycetes bacterium]|nr:DUF1499 domain-containing protein [Planctomycetota bacterium]